MKDKLLKPTQEEIEQAREAFEPRYDILIPKVDLIKLVNLSKELERWIQVGKEPILSSRITEKMIAEFRELAKINKSIDISDKEAHEGAEALLTLAPVKEQQRISESMRAIIISHRPIPYEPVVEAKAASLFKLQYGTVLAQSQLEQVVQFLTRTLWFQEGLDESLERCLDDLIIYVDKRKRGKRVSGLNPHSELRKALDEAMGRLNISSGEWERLYQD